MPHRDRRIGEQDAAPIERFSVDRVVADAVARDHPQPTALALELGVRHLGAANEQAPRSQ